MTAIFTLLGVLVLFLAANTDAQSNVARSPGHEEEEEKKINVVRGDDSYRSTASQPTDVDLFDNRTDLFDARTPIDVDLKVSAYIHSMFENFSRDIRSSVPTSIASSTLDASSSFFDCAYRDGRCSTPLFTDTSSTVGNFTFTRYVQPSPTVKTSDNIILVEATKSNKDAPVIQEIPLDKDKHSKTSSSSSEKTLGDDAAAISSSFRTPVLSSIPSYVTFIPTDVFTKPLESTSIQKIVASTPKFTPYFTRVSSQSKYIPSPVVEYEYETSIELVPSSTQYAHPSSSSVPELSSEFVDVGTTPSSIGTVPETTTKSPPTTPPEATTTPIESTTKNITPVVTDRTCTALPLCIEVTILETTWDQFCPHSYDFQEFLSRAVSHYTRPIHPRQMVLESPPCRGALFQDRQLSPDLTMPLYVIDEAGHYDEGLTEICAVILRRLAPAAFRDTVIEIRLMNGAEAKPKPTPRPSLPEFNSGFVAAVSISAVAGVALCLLCIVLVVMKQKLLQNRSTATATPAADAYSLDSLSVNNSFRRRRNRRSGRSYLNHGFNDQEFASHPLNEKSLANCLKNRELLEEEFKKIPLNMPKLGEIPEGADVKNRYSNILPRAESRVVLAEPSGDPLKSYINANYVKGYGGKTAFYIACQAPLPEGVEDFWRMIWEQQCKLIIMLTMFDENGVSRCAQYFPQSTVVSHPPYGDYQVSLLKKEVYEFHTMSTFRLLDLEKSLFRDIVHFWYTNWPDVGVPKDPSNLVSFVMQCRPFINSNTGPTVVHCSTGTGRSGVFLALDICMREYDDSRSIDILQCITQLRRDRGGAVQNKDQYILIYEAMLEYVSRMANQSERPSLRSNAS